MDTRITINNELDTITECGRCFFSIKETAIVIEVPFYDLKTEFENINSGAYKAYYKGFLESKMKLHKSLLDLAENGSSPAQSQLQEIYKKANVANS